MAALSRQQAHSGAEGGAAAAGAGAGAPAAAGAPDLQSPKPAAARGRPADSPGLGLGLPPGAAPRKPLHSPDGKTLQPQASTLKITGGKPDTIHGKPTLC